MRFALVEVDTPAPGDKRCHQLVYIDTMANPSLFYVRSNVKSLSAIC